MSAGELRSQSHEPLIYPTEAHLARIQGTVVLAFDVNSEGVPVSPEVITGHPIFAAAAIRNLLTWRFARTPELATVGRQQARYLFEFSGTFTEGFYDSAKDVSKFEGIHTVKVTVIATPGLLQAENCASLPSHVPATPAGSQDFVSLNRSGCFGKCPVYELSIYGDGRVI